MKKVLTLLMVFCLFGHSFAQQALRSENGENYFSFDHFNEAIQTYEDIDGSPFLFDEWQPAVFKFEFGEDIKIGSCKFDVYQNKLLFQNKDKSYYITNLNTVKKFSIGNSKFLVSNKAKENDFFEILVEKEDLVLLKKYECEILEGKESDGINLKKNDRFKINSIIYAKKGEAPMQIIKLKEKYVLEFMYDKKQDIKEFIASNKLNCKNEEDLAKIFEHYSSLI